MEGHDRTSPLRVRPPRIRTDDGEEQQQQQQRRWRTWAVPFLSLVVIMGLLTAAQSHLTAYEEKLSKEIRLQEDKSYAVLRDGPSPHMEKHRPSGHGGGGESKEGRPSGHKDEPAAEPPADMIRDLVALSRPAPSRRGKQYRSLICALSRNDVHLREYIVRNLLAGFQHIVLYDNNQVGKGFDLDIRAMVAPFVEAGLVTHVPWDQNSTSRHLDNDKKNGNSRQCLEEFGPQADWVSIMDTDEVFYLHKEGVGALGALNDYLDDLEAKAPTACATSFPWRMMYGERRVLKPPGLLMDAHHQVCKVHEATKMLFRPDWSNPYNIPHFLVCTNPNGDQFRTDDDSFKRLLGGGWTLHLVHYYAKSVEEWMTKLEQSIPPYIRYLPEAYDHARACLQDFVVTYDPDYEKAVRSVMGRFWRTDEEGSGDGGRYLGPAPEFGWGKLERGYELYLFFKLRVAMRDEWDEHAYLREHGEVAEAVKQRQWVDGLQHFMEEGFQQGKQSCWIRQGTIRFCI